MYHLHPELVEMDGDTVCTKVCHSCQQAIVNGSVPQLSIANDVDFGNYHRLGLTTPNLHEWAIIARVRRFLQKLRWKSSPGGKESNP